MLSLQVDLSRMCRQRGIGFCKCAAISSQSEAVYEMKSILSSNIHSLRCLLACVSLLWNFSWFRMNWRQPMFAQRGASPPHLDRIPMMLMKWLQSSGLDLSGHSPAIRGSISACFKAEVQGAAFTTCHRLNQTVNLTKIVNPPPKKIHKLYFDIKYDLSLH